MNYTNLFFGIALIAIISASAIGISTYSNHASERPGQYDDFAKCLNETGLVEYGAYWCPKCQEQKLMFGNSFKNINYVECEEGDAINRIESEVCKSAGIEAYPTWVFEEQQYPGVQTFERLSQITGCEI